MFVFINELIADLDLQEKCSRLQSLHGTRFFMLPCLLQVDAIAGAIERHFALLATTLRADASMHGRAKALFLPLFSNHATHESGLPSNIMTCKSDHPRRGCVLLDGVRNCKKSVILEPQDDGKADFYGFFGS